MKKSYEKTMQALLFTFVVVMAISVTDAQAERDSGRGSKGAAYSLDTAILQRGTASVE